MTITLVGSDTIKTNCTASSEYSATYSPNCAWDGNAAGTYCWLSDGSGAETDGSCWIQWDFLSPVIIEQFRFCARDAGAQNQFPDSIKVYGSDTGSFGGEEIHLGDFNCSQPSGAGEWCNLITISSPQAFRYLRVQIHTQQSVPGQSSQTWVAIEEAEFTLSEVTVDLKIDHDEIDSTLSDFPVMVNLATYPEVFEALGEDANRKKIAIEDSSGNPLYGELEHFDFANNKGTLWVKIPSVSDSVDTEFSLVIGTASAVTAKSVIIDIADNWGDGTFLALRSADFYKDGALIPLTDSDITCYATSEYSAQYPPKNSFITALSKTGMASGLQWYAGSGNVTSQRLICVFDTVTEFDEIVINNAHTEGTYYSAGAKNIVINISDDSITDTTYNAAIANSTEIFDGQIAAHVASDIADDQDFPLYVEDTGEWAAQQVWDSNFLLVYHMAQDPSGGADCILDSTSNGNTGTPGGTMLTEDLVDADNGAKALDFDGSGDNIHVIDSAVVPTNMQSIGDSNQFTLEAVVNGLITGSVGSDWRPSDLVIELRTQQSNNSHIAFSFGFESSKMGLGRADNYISSNERKRNTTALSSATTTVCSAVVDNDGVIFYKDGVADGSETYTTATGDCSVGTTTSNLRIAARSTDVGGAADYFDGEISEIRISNTNRSAAWMKATSASITDSLVTEDAGIPATTGDIAASFPALTASITNAYCLIGSTAAFNNIKSISIDIVNNWAGSGHGTIRSIEFYYRGNLLHLADEDITCYRYLWDSSGYDSARHSKYAFITGLSKTGTDYETQYESVDTAPPCRISCVFDDLIDFDKIVINNGHVSGASTDLGVKDIVITASPDTVTSIVYNEAVSNGMLVYEGEVAQHPAADTESDQTILDYNPVLFPPLASTIGSGAYLSPVFSGLTAILEANKFSFSGPLVADLDALTMTGLTGQYREVEASIAALTASLQATANFVRLTPSFPRLSVVLGTGAYINTEVPKLQSVLSGQNGIIASLNGSFKALTERSYVGGACITELPTLNCTLIGTTLAMCSISMSLPKLNSAIVAKFNSPIDMTFGLPKLKSSIIAFNTASGSLSFSLPIINMNADGILGILASLEANIPFFRQTRISASQSDINNLISQMPMLSSSFNIEDIPESVLRYIRGQLR